MLVIAALCVMWQEDVWIERKDKGHYPEAIQLCKDAEKALNSDEKLAIEKLTRVVNDSAIVRIECIIHIQIEGRFEPPYRFLPYNYLGRAELSLAKKTDSLPAKKDLLNAAIGHLEKSVSLKFTDSEKPLKDARVELGKLNQPPPPNLPTVEAQVAKVRAGSSTLMMDLKFKSARAFVDREGGALPESERAKLASETDSACLEHIRKQLLELHRSLLVFAKISDLRAMTKDDFDTAFKLPQPEEMCIVHPEYVWARAYIETLRSLRKNEEASPSLRAMAESASLLEGGAENPLFKNVEGFLFQKAMNDVERLVASCADAPKASRGLREKEAHDVIDGWEDFLSRLKPEIRQGNLVLANHSSLLAAPMARMPRDILAGLRHEDLRWCFESPRVAERLKAKEDEFISQESKGGITLESRQELYMLIIAARSARLFLAGSSDEEVANTVKPVMEKFKDLGGRIAPDRFGGRIQEIFSPLR
jgi:hypothetical protein